MFDIGAPELFIVAVLAIIVVGPKDLPKLIRSVMGMVKKVREMGSEFQAGVKKMADEVELDAVTRKLNEAANISLDEKPKVDPKAEFSDYDEFDYDDYDYDNKSATKPAIKEKSADTDKSDADAGDSEELIKESPDIIPEETEVAEVNEKDAKVETPTAEENVEASEELVKSK